MQQMQHSMGMAKTRAAKEKSTRMFKNLEWKTFRFIILNRAGRIAWRKGIKVIELTKNNETELLYLIDVLLPPIEAQIGKYPVYVFPNPRTFTDGRLRHFNYFWPKALEKANLKNKRFHDLRTSAVRY